MHEYIITSPDITKDAFGNVRMIYDSTYPTFADFKQHVLQQEKEHEKNLTAAFVVYGVRGLEIHAYNVWAQTNGYGLATLKNQDLSCHVMYRESTCPKVIDGCIRSAFVCRISRFNDINYLWVVKDRTKPRLTLPGGTHDTKRESYKDIAMREFKEETTLSLPIKCLQKIGQMQFLSTYLNVHNINDKSEIFYFEDWDLNGMECFKKTENKCLKLELKDNLEIDYILAVPLPSYSVTETEWQTAKPQNMSGIAWLCAQRVVQRNTTELVLNRATDKEQMVSLGLPPMLQSIVLK